MTLTRSPAVVLKVADYGESDKIITFYSLTAGRQVGFAKGAKKSNKRFVNKLEMFSWLEIGYSRRRQDAMAYITEADLLDSFASLRCDFKKYAAASLITELVLSWTKENDPDEALYSTILWALKNLNSNTPSLPTIIIFQLKLLKIVGYQPCLSECVDCGSLNLAAKPFHFNLGKGGLVCSRCRTETSFSSSLIPLSLSTIKILQSAQDMPLEKINRLRFSIASQKEALELFKKYDERLLQREIQSWEFLT
jgi:DNA repair protein RecO (recombination protein O)